MYHAPPPLQCPLPRRFGDNTYFRPFAVVGGYNRAKDPPGSYETRRVVATVPNPDYVGKSYDKNKDIALMLLDRASSKTAVGLPPFTRECWGGGPRPGGLPARRQEGTTTSAH